MYEESLNPSLSPQKYGDLYGIDRRIVTEVCETHYEGFPASRLGGVWKINKAMAVEWTADRFKKGLPLYERKKR